MVRLFVYRVIDYKASKYSLFKSRKDVHVWNNFISFIITRKNAEYLCQFKYSEFEATDRFKRKFKHPKLGNVLYQLL